MKNLMTIIMLTALYAIFRYHIYGVYSISFFPIFTINKICAVVALIYMGLSLKNSSKFKGVVVFISMLTHLVLSLILLSFNENGAVLLANKDLPLLAQCSLLMGVIAFVGLSYLKGPGAESGFGHSQKQRAKFLGPLLFCCVLLHTTFLGLTKWTDFAHWPAMLPPITLLVTVIGIGLLIFSLIRVKSNSRHKEHLTLPSEER